MIDLEEIYEKKVRKVLEKDSWTEQDEKLIANYYKHANKLSVNKVIKYGKQLVKYINKNLGEDK